MTEQSVQSWSQILPSTNPLENATQDNVHRTTQESIFYECDSFEYSSEDVVIHCPKCDTYVKVETLRSHKAYHKALETLEWTKKEPPQNVSCLIEQRNTVLSRLKDGLFKKIIRHRSTHARHKTRTSSVSDSSTEILSRIEELNRAFEYLKNDIDPLACSLTPLPSAVDTGNGSRHHKPEMEIDERCNMSFTSKLSCVYGVGICSIQNEAYRRDMEDAAVFEDCFLAGNDDSAVNTSYFAVFDGYRGSTAASVSAKYLHGFLKDAITSCSLLDKQAQSTIDNLGEVNCFHTSRQAGRDSKDGQILRDCNCYLKDNDKENLTLIFDDSCSECPTKETREKRRERTVSKSINDSRNQSQYLDVDFDCDQLRQKDTVDEKQRDELLDRYLEDQNRLHLERNETDAHNINNGKDNTSQNKEIHKQETPDTRPESQTDNGTIDECFTEYGIPNQTNCIPEGCIPNQTECIPERCIPNWKKSKEIDHSVSMSAAFKMAYQQTDAILSHGVGETSRVRWSGCSAVTLLIESAIKCEDQNKSRVVCCQRQSSNDRSPKSNVTVSSSSEKSPTTWSTIVANPEEVVGRLYVANVGNVQAFVVKGNRAYRLIKKHTPQNKQERQRILQQGGFFTKSSSESLVNGVLKTTRGLGNHGDEKMRRCVLPVPSIYYTDIEHQSQMLIIASAGVWDVLSGQETASLLVQLLPMNRLPVPSRVSTSLMQLFTNRLPGGFSQNSNNGKNESLKYQQTGTSTKDNSKTKEQKEITNSTTNEEHSLKDLNLSTKSGYQDLVDLQSKSEVDGKAEFVDLSSGVESGDSKTNTLDINNITRNSLSGIPQSEVRQHFGQVMSRYLVQAAMLAGSRQNITAMVVLLPGSGL